MMSRKRIAMRVHSSAAGNLSALAILVAAFALSGTSALAQVSKPFEVIGYIEVFRLTEFDSAPLEMLDELIYHGFRPLPDGSLQRNSYRNPSGWHLGSDFEKNKGRLDAIRAEHPDLAIRFGVIGREDEFGPVAANVEKRRKFATALLTLCREGEFVGVDLDYEYPRTPEEKEDYAKLIKEVCRTLQPAGFSVTAALSFWNLPERNALRSLDCVHLRRHR